MPPAESLISLFNIIKGSLGGTPCVVEMLKTQRFRGGQKGGSGKKVPGSGTVPWRFRHGSGEKASGSGALPILSFEVASAATFWPNQI